MISIIAIILLIIWVVPILCEKVHIPAIVGLILAGVLVGPAGIGMLDYDQVMERLGYIGMLYVMFISSIEIDMNEMHRARRKSFFFGVLTFGIPFLMGAAMGRWLFHYQWMACMLIGAMMGSHTLMTYPLVRRHGMQQNRSISIVIGATILAVTAAMMVLAAVSTVEHGHLGGMMWIQMAIGAILLCYMLYSLVPRMVPRFFERHSDPVVEFVFVLLIAAVSGWLADWAGLEPILGVFLAGLSVNKHIPNDSQLMHNIQFMGSAIFIPIFMLSVGMLLDMSAFTHGPMTLAVGGAMCVTAISSKWLAAWTAGKCFLYEKDEQRLLFGLTNSHAAGSLATVMIGYQIMLPNGEHLLNEHVLNGTVIMILVSCGVSSFVTEHALRNMKKG